MTTVQQINSSIQARRQALTVVAWTAMLLTSSLALILWRELGSGEAPWWAWVHVVGLVALLVLTFASSTMRPLRGFILVLLVIFTMGLGGGWQFGFIPYVRESSIWANWTSETPWAISAVATHLLRSSPALAVLLVLLLMGLRRRDFFLVKGRIDAPAEPSRLLGMKKPEPWTRLGTIFAVIITAGTFTFLVLSTRPSLSAVERALPLFPVAVLIAAVNAFNEEFPLRAALLSQALPALGKRQTLMVTTVLFGLGHFYGIPNGVTGVLLSGFLGWFLGKSMLETKGFFWAWLIHFLQDVIIFSFLAMAA